MAAGIPTSSSYTSRARVTHARASNLSNFIHRRTLSRNTTLGPAISGPHTSSISRRRTEDRSISRRMAMLPPLMSSRFVYSKSPPPTRISFFEHVNPKMESSPRITLENHLSGALSGIVYWMPRPRSAPDVAIKRFSMRRAWSRRSASTTSLEDLQIQGAAGRRGDGGAAR